MQKTLLSLATAALLSLVAATAHAASKTYYGPLGTGNVVPPFAGNGSGATILSFDDQTKELTGTISFAGTTGAPTAGHIHEGACGENGPEIYTFPDVSKSPANVKVTLTGPQEQALVQGRLYVDFHTAANPNGEIRGQLFDSLRACPATDAGTPPAATPDAGGTTTTPSDPTPSASADGGATTPSSAPAEDDGGCAVAATQGPADIASAASVLGLALAAVAVLRRRRPQ